MKKQLIILALLGLGCASSQASQELAAANAELRNAVLELSKTLTPVTPNQGTVQKSGVTFTRMNMAGVGNTVGYWYPPLNKWCLMSNGLDGTTYIISEEPANDRMAAALDNASAGYGRRAPAGTICSLTGEVLMPKVTWIKGGEGYWRQILGIARG